VNAAQARAVTATFAYVSELLGEVLRVARGDVTPFDRQRMDISPEEAALLEDVAKAVRGRMSEAVVDLGIPAPMPDGSALWNARTSLHYADIALSELTPHHLRAYGAIGDAEAREVAEVADGLRKMIADTHAALASRGPAVDPGAGA
jgi:hypothetical protein